MASKYTEQEHVNLDQVIGEMTKLYGKKIIVGPAAAENSELAIYAAANEFGATITGKKGFLAIPCHPDAKGRRPSDFGNLVFIPGKNKGYAYLAMVSGSGKSSRRVNYFLLKKTVRIPERSWLRGAFDMSSTVDKAMRLAADAIARVIGGSRTARQVCDIIGLSFVSSVKQRIASNVPPSNAPLTMVTKRSGSSTLIDEGRLLGSIQHEVID